MKRVHPPQLCPMPFGTANLAPVLCLDVAVAAASAGARDVSIFTANAPHSLSVLSAEWTGTTAGAADSNAQLRTATGGGGTALSGPIPLDAAGRSREGNGGTLPAATTVARGGSMVFRMSDGTAAGRLIVYYRRND